jgi:hypothetical protein
VVLHVQANLTDLIEISSVTELAEIKAEKYSGKILRKNIFGELHLFP